MAERENWLHESRDERGTTTFVVQQRNMDHFKVIGKALAAVIAGFIICTILIGKGGGGMIVGFLILLFVLLFGFVVAVTGVIAMLASLGLRSRVSFSIAGDQLLLTEKVKDSYPSTIERSRIASLYIDGPRDTGEVSSSRVIVGPPGFVAAQGAAHAAADMSSSIGKAMGMAIFASRYTVSINAGARKIHLANALAQPEAEYLMHRIELAWAR